MNGGTVDKLARADRAIWGLPGLGLYSHDAGFTRYAARKYAHRQHNGA